MTYDLGLCVTNIYFFFIVKSTGRGISNIKRLMSRADFIRVRMRRSE